MTPLGWIITGICIFMGVVVGKFLFKRFPNLLSKDKRMEKVLKDPHLLAEKLKEHGKIYDMGKELDIKVGVDKETDQDVVMIEEKEVAKPKASKKKIADKPKTKKKVKK